MNVLPTCMYVCLKRSEKYIRSLQNWSYIQFEPPCCAGN